MPRSQIWDYSSNPHEMNNLKNLMTEITRITTEIETEHPELYRFLDENPMTLPATGHPEINKAVLEEYLQSLRQELRHYLEAHRADTT